MDVRHGALCCVAYVCIAAYRDQDALRAEADVLGCAAPEIRERIVTVAIIGGGGVGPGGFQGVGAVEGEEAGDPVLSSGEKGFGPTC